MGRWFNLDRLDTEHVLHTGLHGEKRTILETGLY